MIEKIKENRGIEFILEEYESVSREVLSETTNVFEKEIYYFDFVIVKIRINMPYLYKSVIFYYKDKKHSFFGMAAEINYANNKEIIKSWQKNGIFSNENGVDYIHHIITARLIHREYHLIGSLYEKYLYFLLIL